MTSCPKSASKDDAGFNETRLVLPDSEYASASAISWSVPDFFFISI